MLNDERNHCPCKYKVVWDYLKSLEDTGAWPIDRAARSHSINELLSRLHGRFNWTDTHPDHSRCIYCVRAFAAVVREAVDTTRTYFNGLCLGEHLIWPETFHMANQAQIAYTILRPETTTWTITITPTARYLAQLMAAATITDVALSMESQHGTSPSNVPRRTLTSGDLRPLRKLKRPRWRWRSIELLAGGSE